MAYTDEQIVEAKENIINGITDGRSMVSIVNLDKEMPSIRTVFNWLNEESDYFDKEFLHNYAMATTIRSEREFEEILAIADDQEQDVIIGEDGKEIVNYNVINRSRLRVDARKWRLGKMQPKKYGDSSSLDITSLGEKINDGIDYSKLSTATLRELAESKQEQS